MWALRNGLLLPLPSMSGFLRSLHSEMAPLRECVSKPEGLIEGFVQRASR